MGRTAKACAINGCLEYSYTLSGYCPTHTTEVNRPRMRRKANRRRQAPGNNAATKYRRIMMANWEHGTPTQCAHCKGVYPPIGIQVDHIRPLIEGGHDVDTNVQPLCVQCHQAKTTDEATARRKGRTSL